MPDYCLYIGHSLSMFVTPYVSSATGRLALASQPVANKTNCNKSTRGAKSRQSHVKCISVIHK